ncbi:integration host factor subunit beta [Immundisolibacter sp.]|uniref:integration host factor subunit beta n=1 Tax=Immundisolibacter sp. TaxID=1934948 RepID=UPI0019B3D0B7|nr:integration host factor subunit beta [Immundisolibacter sp.]MBC7163236.1 integration host factor subunit beta [Immundisolibacter sp.]MEA3221074.1 Integration host factor subunit beta [Immundisolibacter sp.]
MVRSQLIELLAQEFEGLSTKDLELAVKLLQEQMIDTLGHGGRIEIRGFGSFSLHYRRPKLARNPKTGESVPLGERYVVHFKPGKDLRQLVDNGLPLLDNDPD